MIKNKTLEWTFGILITGIVILFIVSIYAVSNMFSFKYEKFYSKEDLINNYNKNKEKILDAKDYFNKIVPSDKTVDIEFKNDNEISRLEIINLNVKTNNYSDKYFEQSDLDINSPVIDSISSSLGWTKKTFAQIKAGLDKAACISIKNGEPTIVGFQRSGFGMYFYDLFSITIPDNLKTKYNDSCTHIYLNEKVVLEYGGGAIGPQCFLKQ